MPIIDYTSVRFLSYNSLSTSFRMPIIDYTSLRFLSYNSLSSFIYDEKYEHQRLISTCATLSKHHIHHEKPIKNDVRHIDIESLIR